MYANGNKNNDRQTNVILCRGVRGAITVNRNDAEEILTATRELLQAIVDANHMHVDDITSVYFTTTTDLNATYPALAARQLGWVDAALMCGHEMDVPGSLQRCIRVMIHWNTTRTPQEIAHIYMREARSLRPDRKDLPPIRPPQIDPMEAMIRVLELQHSH